MTQHVPHPDAVGGARSRSQRFAACLETGPGPVFSSLNLDRSPFSLRFDPMTLADELADLPIAIRSGRGPAGHAIQSP